MTTYFVVTHHSRISSLGSLAGGSGTRTLIFGISAVVGGLGVRHDEGNVCRRER